MNEKKKLLKVTEPADGYLRVTIDNPPVNVFSEALFAELQDVMAIMETREDVKVVVFDSANPEFFIAHFDMFGDPTPWMEKQDNGLYGWPEFQERLSRSPVITISSVRGRARGVGSEFVLATDIRFASREKAVFHQPELGMNVTPGGGALERLPRLVGRSRALEIVLGSEEFDADQAALYGWINRAIPDAELDVTVDNFARRIRSFDRRVLGHVKDIINKRAGLPTVEETTESYELFFKVVTEYPEVQQTWDKMKADGLQRDGDLERYMGEYFTQRAGL